MNFQPRMVLKSSVLAAAAMLPITAWSWGQEGHRVVALIAESKLTPAAQLEVNRLLSLMPGATLDSVASWADEHKSPATKAWHYVNFPRGDCHYDAERDCPDGECVVAAIQRESQILASRASDEKRLHALLYLDHLVGDSQQPLHAGFGDDKGGNAFQVRWDGRGTNLHHVWDDSLIEAIDPDAESLARTLEREAPIGSYVQSADPVQWVEEGCRIASQDGFYPSNRKIGLIYLLGWRNTVKSRLQIGGERLAELLNSELK